MKHRGELLSKAIAKSQLKKVTVAKLFKCSVRYIYDLVEKDIISNDDMLRYGKLLGYDFSIDLPELVEYSMIKEPKEAYIANTQYREKYFELLEKHIIIIEELEKIKKEKEPITYKKLHKKNAPSEPSAPKVRQNKSSK